MRPLLASALAALLALSGCAHISTRRTLHDTTLSESAAVGRAYNPRVVGSGAATADGIAVTLTSLSSCDRARVRKVRRKEHRQRSASTFTQVLEYGFGLIFVGGGGYLYAENGNSPPDDPSEPFDVTDAEVATYMSYGALGLGGLLLLTGVIDSVRARDSGRDLGEVKSRVPGTHKTITCGKRPAADVELTLVVVGRSRITLGKTNAKGHLRVAWSALPAAVRGVGQTGVIWADTTTVAELELNPPGKASGEEAWAEAQRLGTREAYERYRKNYPDQHREDVAELLKQATVQELIDQFAVAMAKNDLARAKQLLDEWQALEPGNPGIAKQQEELKKLAEATSKDAAWARLLVLVEAARAEGAPASAVVELLRQLAAVQAIDPGDPRLHAVMTSTAEAQRDHLKRLLAAIKQNDKKREEGLIDQALADARSIAPGEGKELKALAQLEGKIAQRRKREAGQVDKLAAAEQKRAEAAEKKAEKQRLAAEKRAEKQRLADEKKAEGDGGAAEKKAEKDRVAAEKKAEKQRLAAEKQAAKSQTAAEKQAAKEREATDKKTAKEREAAEKQAAKEREASEKQAAKEREASEKQAAKEREAAEKAEKEREATDKKTAKLTPQLAWTLDPRFQDDNILARMPYPDACAVALGGGQSRADLRCPGYSVLITKKGIQLDATCQARTCAQCTDLMNKLLAPFSKAAGPGTKLSRACE